MGFRLEKDTKRMIRNWAKKNNLFIFSYNPFYGVAGMTDFIMIYKGNFIGIEAKSETGKLTSIQLAIHERIEEYGGIVYVVRDQKDLEDIELELKI